MEGKATRPAAVTICTFGSKKQIIIDFTAGDFQKFITDEQQLELSYMKRRLTVVLISHG